MGDIRQLTYNRGAATRAGGRCSAGPTAGAVLDLHFELCSEKIKQGDEPKKGLGVVRGI